MAPGAAEEVKHLDLLDEAVYRVLLMCQLRLPVSATVSATRQAVTVALCLTFDPQAPGN